MTLDTEEHKIILLELLANSSFKGAAVESIYELKQSILKANILEYEVEGET